MDQTRTGALIRQLRIRSGLTQKQLAEQINVSDKAVSKWECGNGSPDISLLPALAETLGTDMQTLLSGAVRKNESEKGDMKKIRFYVCRECGNIITATSEASITCCGKTLTPAEPAPAPEANRLRMEEIDGEWYVTADHEMRKEHYISFAAYINDSTVMLFKQYPEWEMQFRMPLCRSGRLVWYCTECGLLYQDIRRRGAPAGISLR